MHDIVRSFFFLRIFSCGLVLIAHTTHLGNQNLWTMTLFHGGGVGVDIFFLMSGFLITRIILRDCAKGVPLHWFITRRMLRTLPPYILLLILFSLLRWSLGLPAVHWSSWYYGYNLHDPYGTGNAVGWGHTWSLSVEEQFYLAWACIAFTVSRKVALLVTLAGLPLSVKAAHLLDSQYPNSLVVYTHTFTKVLPLATGSFFAFCEGWLFGRQTPLVRAVLSQAQDIPCRAAVRLLLRSTSSKAAAFVLLVLSPYFWLLLVTGDAIAQYKGSYLLAAALFIASVSYGEPRLKQLGFPEQSRLRDIEAMTYGVYLYHGPMFALCGIAPSVAVRWHTCAEALALTAAATVLSYYLLEKKCIAYGRKHFSSLKSKKEV